MPCKGCEEKVRATTPSDDLIEAGNSAICALAKWALMVESAEREKHRALAQVIQQITKEERK